MTWRSAITLAIAALVSSPLVRAKSWDDFPISSYPMFSRSDMSGAHPLAHALVVHTDGRRTPARPVDVGTPEPMVANAVITRALIEGHAQELCEVIAKNVADADGVSVEVVLSQYDPTKYFAEGSREPESRVVYATCAVKR